MDIIKEQRKSNKNATAEIIDARVIANFSDPGLNQDYFFDVLSTFVIVMIESVDRVPILDDKGANNMFAIVARPKTLWITAGTNTNNPATQTRQDYNSNICVGNAGNFSVNGIAPINNPYQLGELIKIRKLSQPHTFPNSTFFTSQVDGFSKGITNYGTIYSNSNPALSLPYIQNTQFASNDINFIPLTQVSNFPVGTYAYFLGKFMYEGFSLYFNSTYNPSNVAGITSIFAGNGINNNNSIYSANGGYLFYQNNYTNNFYSVNYEDTNINGKARISENDCQPLIVVSNSTFPTPAVRQIGNISYNPSYSPIGVAP